MAFTLFVEKNRCYEMSSFDEKQATTLLKERPIEFVNYNKHQLSRVYPAGTRFDSSNFMPQVKFERFSFLVRSPRFFYVRFAQPNYDYSGANSVH